jgi:hypothetical protein
VAIRYTVYCTKSAAHVTPEQLLAGVREADLLTIAENDDVPDDVAETAVSNLAITDLQPERPFTFYRLIYRPGPVRQIDVERWSSPDEVEGDIAELLEDLEAGAEPLLPRIRPHLESVVDVVSASFGSAPGEAMAPILASEVARWLAEHFDGIIRAADDTWWQLGTVGEYVSMTP